MVVMERDLMILHFTEKLRKKLHIQELPHLYAVPGKHLQWYANFFHGGTGPVHS